MYEKMLKAMGDMTDGCKIGIRYADRTLYIDKPSIFQGAIRWLYGQTRDKIKDYIETEIMGSRGFIMLLYEIIAESNDMLALCASSSAPTPIQPSTSIPKATQSMALDGGMVSSASMVILSPEIKASYRNLCAVNVNLMLRINHGLSVIREIYATDAPDLDGYVSVVQRKMKELRLQLETNINMFAYYLPSERRLSR